MLTSNKWPTRQVRYTPGVATPLVGTHTVGVLGEYPSLSEAVADLLAAFFEEGIDRVEHGMGDGMRLRRDRGDGHAFDAGVESKPHFGDGALGILQRHEGRRQ